MKKDLKVLVLYTPGAKEVLPNDAGGFGVHGPTIGLDAMLSIFSANTVLSNSNIPYQISLAGVVELPGYVEQNTSASEINHIATYAVAQQLRSQYHADVVMLMVKPGIFGPDDWGKTREIGSFNTQTGLFDPAYAFSVVDIRRSLWTYTFAHELGHVLGGRHGTDNDNRTNISFLDNNAHAHKFEKWYGPFPTFYRTTMAYYYSGFRNYIPYFSNPDVTYNGKATGTTDQNNAKRIREHFTSIASIYTEPIGFANYFDVQLVPYPPNPKGLQRICNNYAKLTAKTNGCTLLKNYVHSWQISTDGINWIDAGTGTTLTVEPTNSTIFVRLITNTTSPFISRVTYQHTLLFDCPTVIMPMRSTVQTEPLTANKMVVYPNPNVGDFTIKYNSDLEQKANIELLDIRGKSLETLYKGILKKGNHEMKFRIQQKHGAGIYIIKIQSSSINQQSKVIIQ